VYFVGYLYITGLINARNMEHINTQVHLTAFTIFPKTGDKREFLLKKSFIYFCDFQMTARRVSDLSLSEFDASHKQKR
jgi:hypothetical protein